MMLELTWWDEILRAATLSGWTGLVILFVFMGVYLSAIWSALRHRPERAVQRAVIGIFIVAGFNLYSLFHLLQLLSHRGCGPSQAALLWWCSYLQWKISLLLVGLILVPVLLAVLLRPVDYRLKNPGCIPGAIMALLGTLIVHLYCLCVLFGSNYAGALQSQFMVETRLRQRVKQLEQQIETQNKVPVDTVRPLADPQH